MVRDKFSSKLIKLLHQNGGRAMALISVVASVWSLRIVYVQCRSSEMDKEYQKQTYSKFKKMQENQLIESERLSSEIAQRNALLRQRSKLLENIAQQLDDIKKGKCD